MPEGQIYKDPLEALATIPPEFQKLDFVQEAQRRLSQFGLVAALGIGSPDRPIPEIVDNAQIEAIRKRKAGYKDIIGLYGAREASAEFVNYFCGGDFTADKVLLTFGSGEAHKLIAEIFGHWHQDMALVTPHYPPHVDQILNSHSIPVFVKASPPDFIPTYEQLETTLRDNPKVGALTLVYPNNPTGTILSEPQARDFAEILSKLRKDHTELRLIFEEVYTPIVNPFNAENQLDASRNVHSLYKYLSDQAKEKAIVLISGSKVLSLAEDRIGAMLTHDETIYNSVAAAKGNDAMAVPGVLAAGFEVGLRELIRDPNMQYELWKHYNSKVQLVAATLDKISDITIASDIPGSEFTHRGAPAGGMFVMASFPNLLHRPIPEKLRPIVNSPSNTIESDDHFAKLLLGMGVMDHIPLAIATGEGFGIDPESISIRISCVGDETLLQAGMDTLLAAYEMLHQEKKYGTGYDASAVRRIQQAGRKPATVGR